MKLLDKLVKLLTVKSIVTLSLLGGFLYLSVVGSINPDEFVKAFMLVMTFYFGVQSAKGQE